MPTLLDFQNQINVTTRRYIRSKPQLIDDVYNQDPLNYFLRDSLDEKFKGGSSINDDFLFQSMIGGSYLRGKTFNIAQRQTEMQLRWDIKYAQVSIPVFQEDVQVLNKGELAAIDLLKGRVNQSFMSLGAFVSIMTYLNGIQAGYQSQVNGMTEALSDGVNPSWDGNTYNLYGMLTRNSYGPALISRQRNLSGGSLEYDTFDQTYMSAFYGSGMYEPNLVVTTPIGYSYFKTKYQSQQRYNFKEDTWDLGVGFRSMAINGARVVASRYCPGSYATGLSADGVDPIIQTYLQETTENSAATYPVGLLNPGDVPAETMWILNARKPFLNYYVSDDETFGGGLRDFIPSANNTTLVAQVLIAHNLTMHPRYHRNIFGFTS